MKKTRQERIKELQQKNKDLLTAMRIRVDERTIPGLLMDALLLNVGFEAICRLLLQRKVLDPVDFELLKEDILNQVLLNKKEESEKPRIEISQPGSQLSSMLRQPQQNIPRK